MGRFFSIVLIFPILMCVIFLIVMIQYQKSSNQEFSQLRLNHAMNHADDAAMWTLQHENTINAESGEGVIAGTATINPYSAWEIYKMIIKNNFNLSGDTFDYYIERSTPAVLLVTNNGYYAKLPIRRWVESVNNGPGGQAFQYNNQRDKDGKLIDIFRLPPEFGYGWSRKIPFARNVGTSSQPKIVLDTINGKNMYFLDYTKVISSDEGRAYPQIQTLTGNPAPHHDEVEVRAQLISAMSSLINQAKDSDRTSDFFIPQTLDDEAPETYKAETFRGYSLMVAMQDFDPLSTGHSMSNFSISNTQLVQAKKVICMSNGYYIAPADASIPSGAERVVTSMYTAAALGYYPLYRIQS